MTLKQTKQGRPDDECWQHVERIDEKRWKCKYCSRDFGGAVTRVKAHLAGIPGQQISLCHGVVPDNVKRAALNGLPQGRTESWQPQIIRGMAEVKSTRQAQSDLERDDDDGSPDTAALVGVERLQANEVSSSYGESAANLLALNRSFEGSVNVSFDGSINGSFDGSINGSFDGSINGLFDGSIDGSVNEYFEELSDFPENTEFLDVNSGFDCDNFLTDTSGYDTTITDFTPWDFAAFPKCSIPTSSHAQPQKDMTNDQPLEDGNQTIPSECVEEGLPSRKKPKADIMAKSVDQREFTCECTGSEMTNNQSLEANNQAMPAEDVEEQLRLRESRSRMKRRTEIMAMSEDQRETADESKGGKMAHKISLAHLQKFQNKLSAKDTSKPRGSSLEAVVRSRENPRKRPYKPPLNMKWSHEEARLHIGDPNFCFGNRAVDKIMTSEMDWENYNKLSPSKLVNYFKCQYKKAMGEVLKLCYEKNRLNQIVEQAESRSCKVRMELKKVKNECERLKKINLQLQTVLTRKNMEARAEEKEDIIEAYLDGMNFGFENCLDQVKLQFPQLDESEEKINKFKKVVNGQLVDDEDD